MTWGRGCGRKRPKAGPWGDDVSSWMSEVEALLSVDAGRVPAGAVVFHVRDPEAPARRARAVLAFVTFGLAFTCAMAGGGRVPVALLAIAACMLAVSATATAPDFDEGPCKPPTLVVTATGMIVRDAYGLRTWRFDELAEVRPYVHYHRPGLLVIRRNGSCDFVDNQLFQRGDHLRDVIGQRLHAA